MVKSLKSMVKNNEPNLRINSQKSHPNFQIEKRAYLKKKVKRGIISNREKNTKKFHWNQ